MKIKRFEACNMSEALRMIKKEFGEDAVILSAKTAKKAGGLFGSKNSSQVVVTAAIDMTPAKNGHEQSDIPSSEPSAYEMRETNADANPLENQDQPMNSILQRFQPITKTGLQKVRPKLVQLMSDSRAPDQADTQLDSCLYKNLRAKGLAAAIAHDMADQLLQLLPSSTTTDPEVLPTLAQIVEAKGWVTPPQSTHAAKSRPIVLVGSRGVGKTATAAKMAAEAVLKAEAAVCLVSLDHERIAAHVELERYARIIGIRLLTANNPNQLTEVLALTSQAAQIVVDTPGIDLDNLDARESLGRMIEAMGDVEVHLVINACLQEKIMARSVEFFKPLGVSRLLFTQLDCIEEVGPLFNLVDAGGLPLTYMGNGPKVPDGLCMVSAQMVANMLLPESRSSDCEQDRDWVDSYKSNRSAPQNQHPFVANRNSDIFHHVDCKSVKRINNDNILTFRDAEQAKAKGYKPCRMCCAELLVSKPMDRLINRRWVANR